MNININDIKNGMTIIMDGKLCQIVEFQHVKPGKGAAFVKMKLRNLKTGSIVEDTYNTNIKVEKAHIDRKPMQYLYSTGDNYVFMKLLRVIRQIMLLKMQQLKLVMLLKYQCLLAKENI